MPGANRPDENGVVFSVVAESDGFPMHKSKVGGGSYREGEKDRTAKGGVLRKRVTFDLLIAKNLQSEM